jgi:hypothetical protein
LRIHSRSLQHTPARTYCSPSSCMRSKSQLRLPCQLISIILLTISSSFLILFIDGQLQLPCRLLVLYCSPLAVLSLYCYDFHIVLYLYSGIRCHSHTPVGLYCYESSIRPYKVFLAASLPTWIVASCRLYLRHYCRLDSLSRRTTCGITAHLRDLSHSLYTAHR